MAADRERTASLRSFEIRVLRFLNTDVDDHLQEVCGRILAALHGAPLASCKDQQDIVSIHPPHELLQSKNERATP